MTRTGSLADNPSAASQPLERSACKGAEDTPPPPGIFAVWLGAIRPATLSLSLVPVLVGTALAFSKGFGRPLTAIAAASGAIP